MLMAFCVKCNGTQEHTYSIDPADFERFIGPYECTKCGYRWTVKSGRQIPERRHTDGKHQ